uniref:Serine-threonine/tyrosine-protein kinase catalytic domain-containing protein n=1 Tax=Oncorhynchus tshawytscha TaxID=74940 RepID=A0AAZ3P0K1_ONCTS
MLPVDVVLQKAVARQPLRLRFTMLVALNTGRRRKNNCKYRSMTQHTSRLCKGYFSPRRRDGVLHQMTWSPQSPELNLIQMIWDESDPRLKEEQSTSAKHMWELLQDCWNSIPGETG